MNGSYIERAQVVGNTFGTFFSIIDGITASFIGVPPFPTPKKMLSRFSSLFIACTALGTVYSMSSTMKRILRPCTPPLAFASSNAIRMPLALLTPCTAVTPDRSAMLPTMISLSLTPRVAARAMAGANRAPAVPAST